MIERNEKSDIWTAIAAPLPAGVMQWRQQGRPKSRDGKHYALFVAYIDAHFVRERLDAVVPGEWNSDLDMLPNRVSFDGEEDAEPFAFKSTIEVLGVKRADAGQGKDYKTAATDAFKRAAVRFGIGAELYALDPIWVQVDGDGKFAKPVEDPATVYARKSGQRAPAATPRPAAPPATEDGMLVRGDGNGLVTDERGEPVAVRSDAVESCPKCGGKMFDNRAENDARLAKGEKLRPDWACRDKANCGGVVWRPKDTATQSLPF